MEFVSFSRGIMDPLRFHAAGDVLDSPFLNQVKIIAILLPGMHSPWSLCSCSLSRPSHCLREKQEVNQKQEPGEMARLQGSSAIPGTVISRAPSLVEPKARPARAVHWEVAVAWKQQLGTGVIS